MSPSKEATTEEAGMPASEPMGEDRRLALLNRLIETLGEEEA